jgi:hypothetical protein
VPDFTPNIQMEWLVISGAPLLFAGAVIAVGSALWGLIWLIYRGEIKQKNARIESINERLNLAIDKSQIASKVEEELNKKVQTLEKAIAAKADNDSLIKLSAEVKEDFAKLATANNAVSSTLSARLNVTEVPDVASFTIDTNSLDIAQYGALGKLDPETRKKALEGGSQFINIGAKKK